MFAAGVNFASVLVAAIASMLLSLMWYSEPVFGRAWREERMGGARKSRAGGLDWKAHTVHLAVLIVMAFCLAGMLTALMFDDALSGTLVGIFLWTGFVATVKIGESVFGGRSTKAFFIDAGYSLLSMALMGAILTVM